MSIPRSGEKHRLEGAGGAQTGTCKGKWREKRILRFREPFGRESKRESGGNKCEDGRRANDGRAARITRALGEV